LPRDRPVIALAIAILTVEIVGASGSLFTTHSLGTWYGTLQRPMIAPPDWVFGPVWTALFALIGIALWIVWRRLAPRGLDRSWRIRGSLRLQCGMAVIGLLWLLIVTTMSAFDRVDRRAALLLVPYLLWVSFAAYLNDRFWVLN
jgi:tryptophan-rich sensory protein